MNNVNKERDEESQIRKRDDYDIECVIENFTEEYESYHNWSNEELNRLCEGIRVGYVEGLFDSVPRFEDFLDSDGYTLDDVDKDDYEGPSFINYMEYWIENGM